MWRPKVGAAPVELDPDVSNDALQRNWSLAQGVQILSSAGDP